MLRSWRIERHLSVKIGLWLLLIFLMVALFGWDILKDMQRLQDEAQVVGQSNRRSHDLHDLEVHINRYIDPVKEFLITGDYRMEARFNRHYRHLQAAIETYETHYPSHKLGGVLQQLHQMRELSHQIFTLPFAVGNMEGPIILQEVSAQARQAIAQLATQHQQLDAQVNRAMQMMHGLRTDMRDEALALLFLLFVTLLLLTHFIYSRIVLPLVRMRQVVQQVGSGDLAQQCQVNSRDEIGALAEAFNAMSRGLQERDKKLNHARSLAAYQEKMNALGFIAAGIAHEIGNPLSAISISLQLAQRKLPEHPARKQVDAALQQTERIESIIQLILNFARHEPGQRCVKLDIRPLIEHAIYLAQMAPDKKVVSVSYDIQEPLPRIYAHEGMVLQVLINLILNAIDACHEGGEVNLRVFESADSVIIHVQDTGCGIPEEVQRDIFQPHFTSKKRGQGTGLGLAISRELVQSIHGSLRLLHSSPEGSCFEVCLPVKEDGNEVVDC